MKCEYFLTLDFVFVKDALFSEETMENHFEKAGPFLNGVWWEIWIQIFFYRK